MRKTVAEIIAMIGGDWLGEATMLNTTISAICTDSRNVPQDSLFVPIIGEQFDGHRFVEDALQKGAVFSLWKRDHQVPRPKNIPLLLVDDPLKALHEFAHKYRKEVGCRVIAITGSNGKTSTKDIITSLMSVKFRTHSNKGNFNNEIGMPLTLLEMPEDTEVAVLEMGMNHFGEIDVLSKIAEPDMAVITNIGEAHIAHLGSRQGIAQAKLEIVGGMKETGVLYYPGNEPLIQHEPAFQNFGGIKVSCGVDGDFTQSVHIEENLGFDGIIIRDQQTQEQYHIPIPGLHNAHNAAYALAVAKQMGLTTDEIRLGFANVQLSKMRMELLKGKNGVTIINDAYNASLLSMRAALRFFAELKDWKRKIVVLGDIGELGEFGPSIHEQLGKELDPTLFPLVYVIGDLSIHIVEGAKQVGNYNVLHFSDRDALSQHLQHYLNEDTIFLFKASRFMQLEKVIQSLV